MKTCFLSPKHNAIIIPNKINHNSISFNDILVGEHKQKRLIEEDVKLLKMMVLHSLQRTEMLMTIKVLIKLNSFYK